jgi:hypothetical protein
MTKKNTASSDQQSRVAEPKLEHRYRSIGISALVAALQFTSCTKLPVSHSAQTQQDEEQTGDIAA